MKPSNNFGIEHPENDIVFLQTPGDPLSNTLRDLLLKSPEFIVYSLNGGKDCALGYVGSSGPGPESIPVLRSRKRGAKVVFRIGQLYRTDFCWRQASEEEAQIIQ